MLSLTGTVEAMVNYPRLSARYMHEERAGMDCRVRKTNSDEFCMKNKESKTHVRLRTVVVLHHGSLPNMARVVIQSHVVGSLYATYNGLSRVKYMISGM